MSILPQSRMIESLGGVLVERRGRVAGCGSNAPSLSPIITLELNKYFHDQSAVKQKCQLSSHTGNVFPGKEHVFY